MMRQRVRAWPLSILAAVRDNVETFDGVREVFPGDYPLIGRYGVGDLWPMRKGDFERDFKCIDTAG